MAFGRLDPNSTGYVQASGEATPQMPQPQKFVPSARNTNAINDSLRIPPSWNGNTRMMPIVQRAQRTRGMKYLYARGAAAMPVQRMGADGVPVPWTSAFQRSIYGLIHNGGFDYCHFQAGYPGFNLGLSFKVPTLPQNSNQTGQIQRGPSALRSNIGGSRNTVGVKRALGRNLT